MEWVAFFELEPSDADKADWRSTWHTAHILSGLNTNPDWEPDAEFLETLLPTHYVEPTPEPDVVDDAIALQQTILAGFSVA